MRTKKSLSGSLAATKEAGEKADIGHLKDSLSNPVCQPPTVKLSEKEMASVGQSWQSTAKKFKAEEQAQKPIEPEPPSYSVININDFLATELPPRENILAPCLPRQGLAMIHSKRGIGKTFVALNIAYAVACGGKFLRWTAPEPAGVLYLDGEMPAGVIQERLAEIVQYNELEPLKPFLYMSPDMQEHAMPDLSRSEGQKAVNKYLTDEIKLVIVDNISTLSRYGKENEASSWLPLQEWSLKLRAQGKRFVYPP